MQVQTIMWVEQTAWRLQCLVTLLLLIHPTPAEAEDRIFDMDRLATCGQDITVFENDVVLNGRSIAAPANPPLECTVYLKSGYTEADGRYRLQIIIEALDIGDCQVHVDIFNGRGAFGSYLRSLGCNSMTTDTLYTENRQATVRFSRPSHLYKTDYTFTFKIRTYRDIDSGGYDNRTIRLSPGAIIGIIVGIVALFVVAVLILWCYRTGRIGGFYSSGYAGDSNIAEKSASMGEINDATNLESDSLGSAIDYRDPGVWSSVTNGLYNPEQPRKFGRNFYQKKAEDLKIGHELRNQVGLESTNWSRQTNLNNDGGKYRSTSTDDLYEPYDRDTNVRLSKNRNGNAEWKKDCFGDNELASTGHEVDDFESEGTFKRNYESRHSKNSRGSKGSKEAGGSPETKRSSFNNRIDNENAGVQQVAQNPSASELRSSDRNSNTVSKKEKGTNLPIVADDGQEESPGRDMHAQLSTSPTDTLAEQTKDDHFFLDNDNGLFSGKTESKQNNSRGLELGSELQGHINSEFHGPFSDKKNSPSAKKRNKKGREKVDSKDDGLPPEANDPIFTTPVSETPYDPSASLPYTSYGVPSYDAMYPYGIAPLGNFAPLPGQTYAYYQMGPVPGAAQSGLATEQQPVIAGQAAWYVQDTPHGPVEKAFMVTSESPNRNNLHGGSIQGKNYGPPGTPGYTSTPSNILMPKGGKKEKSIQQPDPMNMSVITAGGPPPEPGAGQRSTVVRKSVDPYTGMQKNQIVWKDTIVDPTDPPPDANPKITRKTLTRITTHSGHGDLPTDLNPVAYNDYSDRLGIESDSPDFLSPSHSVQVLPNTSAATPDADNMAFYLGQGRLSAATEPIIHNPSSRNKAFRDRINMNSSEA